MELKAHDFSKLAKLNRYSLMHMTRAGPKMTNGKQNKKTTSSLTSQSCQRLHTDQGNRGEVIPLQPVGVDDIIGKVNLPREELIDILERLAERGFLFSGRTKEGKMGVCINTERFRLFANLLLKGGDDTIRKEDGGNGWQLL